MRKRILCGYLLFVVTSVPHVLQLLRRQDLCSCDHKSVEQFAGRLTNGRVVILPVQAVAKYIFISTVRPRRIVKFSFLTAPCRNICTYLLTYLLKSGSSIGWMDVKPVKGFSIRLLDWFHGLLRLPCDCLSVRTLKWKWSKTVLKQFRNCFVSISFQRADGFSYPWSRPFKRLNMQEWVSRWKIGNQRISET